ncbi:MAG: hypothetical protein Q8M31_06695 [Beijerinckiaceae bacterium]|nr:hypothetical protein [Beijerinckiaceae bacterium]
MRPQKRGRKSVKKRRSKNGFKSKKSTVSAASEQRNLMREYSALEAEERQIIDERGLTNCLELLIELLDAYRCLDRSLAELDQSHSQEIKRVEAIEQTQTGEAGNAGPPVDLLWSLRAISVIQNHLAERLIESDTLEKLKQALIATFYGRPPRMFLGPPKEPHRPPDTPKILEIKGMLAAAMNEFQRREKLSRSDAATKVLKNISQDLKEHLSNKNLSVRMIQDWRDTFGSSGAKPSVGREFYLKFKKAFSNNPDAHDEYIRHLTAHYARMLPSL